MREDELGLGDLLGQHRELPGRAHAHTCARCADQFAAYQFALRDDQEESEPPYEGSVLQGLSDGLKSRAASATTRSP